MTVTIRETKYLHLPLAFIKLFVALELAKTKKKEQVIYFAQVAVLKISQFSF
jgi:hypothetical protein